MFPMPRKGSDLKTELIATRVTPAIKRAISREARRVGLDVSEWLRMLIINELKRSGVIAKSTSESDCEVKE